MFGYTLISKKRLQELENAETLHLRFRHYYHWFSGWPHIHRLLSKFVNGEVHVGSVWGARDELAKAMGTDDWGRSKP